MGATSGPRQHDRQSTRAHIDPNVAFPFQDDFSVGTIHGANVTNHLAERVVTVKEADVVEIQDEKDDVSVLTTNTQAEDQTEDVIESRIPTGPNPVSSPTAASAQAVTNAGDRKILSVLARQVEPPVGRGANSYHSSSFYIREREDE